MSALGLETEELHPGMSVETLVGGRVSVDRICRGSALTILDRTLIYDFIVLEMAGFDLVLGMDWLSFFHATIDCHRCRVCLMIPEGDQFCFTGDRYRVVDPSILDHRIQDSVTFMLSSLTLGDSFV